MPAANCKVPVPVTQSSSKRFQKDGLTRLLKAALPMLIVVHQFSAPAVASAQSPTPAEPLIPAQYIAKQYTELLGRAPSAAEWRGALDSFGGRPCGRDLLSEITMPLETSEAFDIAYPTNSPAPALRRAQRMTALIRAAFNHNPNAGDWRVFAEPYIAGSRNWNDTVIAVLGSGAFSRFIVPRACDPGNPSHDLSWGCLSGLPVGHGGWLEGLAEAVEGGDEGGSPWPGVVEVESLAGAGGAGGDVEEPVAQGFGGGSA